jgi:hypothetical protein
MYYYNIDGNEISIRYSSFPLRNHKELPYKCANFLLGFCMGLSLSADNSMPNIYVWHYDNLGNLIKVEHHILPPYFSKARVSLKKIFKKFLREKNEHIELEIKWKKENEIR